MLRIHMTSDKRPGRPHGSTNDARKKELEKKARDGSQIDGTEPVVVRMPVAYMKILETESALMGLRRGAFLNLLLRRKLDGVQFERAPGSPEYRFTEEEFTEWKPWTWYMAPLDRVRLEIDKNTDGVGTIGVWITQTLKAWIGQPVGLREPARKRK